MIPLFITTALIWLIAPGIAALVIAPALKRWDKREALNRAWEQAWTTKGDFI